LWLNDTFYSKVSASEWTNRNLPVRNRLVQFLALYTNPESHNAQRYKYTDGQTDDMMMPMAMSYCIAVRSAENETIKPATHEPS